jgi:DNA-binding Lrp family transcriptional regulator
LTGAGAGRYLAVNWQRRVENQVDDRNDPELTPVEKSVIYELGGDLGSGARPYEELGRRVGLSEEETVGVIKGLMDRGLVRRFGATLRHQKSGFTANAMVAWTAPAARVEEVGRILASFDQVTHCYQRRTAPGWTRNLYTMVHAASPEECYETAARMAQAAGLDDYELLFSDRELKKTSMRYFDED